MYKVIGADQKEYGPVSVDQIRTWIAEGRVNAQTRVRAEGAQEWMPLSGFPEFADALGVGPAQPPGVPAALPGGGSREAALQAVRGPAIALIVTASLACLFALWNLVNSAFLHSDTEFLSRLMEQYKEPAMRDFMQRVLPMTAGVGIAGAVFHLAMSILILIGALRMLSLRNYSLAFVASILALVPCITPSCCCVLGLPFGIWALVVLNKPEVKSHFG
jgi:hypothetical protein